MNEQSIEFGSLEDPITPKIIRKSFRIPVIDYTEMNIRIKEKLYKLADISMDGISFCIETESDFFIDEKLTGCELNLKGAVISNLSGTIVHYSQEDDQKGRYGIKWMKLTGKTLKQVETVFLEIKNEYLSKSISDSDIIE